MDPAIVREAKPFKLFAKVFHHVVAFEFAVDQNVQADVFLELQPALGFFFIEGIVCGFIDLAPAQLRPVAAHRRRLREGADGRGGQQGQLQFLGLNGQPGRPIRGPLIICRLQGRDLSVQRFVFHLARGGEQCRIFLVGQGISSILANVVQIH